MAKKKVISKTTIKKLIIGIFAFLLFFAFYHAYFGNKIIPGVHVGNVNLGGKTSGEAAAQLEKSLSKSYTLKLTDQEKEGVYEIKTTAIDLEYDIANTIKEAFEAGRTGNLWIDNKTKLAGLIKTIPIGFSHEFNPELLEQHLSQIKGMVDKPAEDAYFYLDEEETLQIKESQDGRKVNSSKLYTTVIQSFEHIDFSEKELPVTLDKAKINRQDLQQVEGKVAELISKDLTVRHKENAWLVTPQEKLQYITVTKDEEKTSLKLNSKTFESYLEELAKKVNTLPRGKVTKESPQGQVLAFEITETGEEIDTKTFTENFKDTLFGETESGEKTVTIPTIPTDDTSDLTKYGIFALLGYGESDYSGSSYSRIHNLTLAAERASGVLVPPGETYSLNQAVGPINAGTGYNSAWVISNGRTVLGSGGGVCQTSTTLFRAALDSGLPVTERHPHAYRVYYYEHDRPVGFDASIYQPALDLKFKNDSPNYILVQSQNHPEENKLSFKIYGTPDGREVEISEPNIYGVSPAPAPRYEETDTLAKGVVRQVDFAAPGGTSVFTRKVTKNGKKLFEETYKSVYRPWQAVFLVGTKTD